MHRRSFLTTAAAGLMLPALPARAAERVFYTPGMAEQAMAAGEVVFLDFWTDWCPTCAAQQRVLSDLRRRNPGYDAAITFITVEWDRYSDGDLARALRIPRRSTLVALNGEEEIGRIVAGTAEADIKGLMDAALAAATA